MIYMRICQWWWGEDQETMEYEGDTHLVMSQVNSSTVHEFDPSLCGNLTVEYWTVSSDQY